jgi:hypothetical protein
MRTAVRISIVTYHDMKEITLKREREAWRGVVWETRPWPYVVKFWDDWTIERPKLEPLRQLIHTLADSPASAVLFVSNLRHGDGDGIVVSDSPDFHRTDGVLEIYFRPGGGHFEFHHRTFSGHDDHKMCLASEAIETLRLFLRYKFGVLLEGPVWPNTALEPTSVMPVNPLSRLARWFRRGSPFGR